MGTGPKDQLSSRGEGQQCGGVDQVAQTCIFLFMGEVKCIREFCAGLLDDFRAVDSMVVQWVTVLLHTPCAGG